MKHLTIPAVAIVFGLGVACVWLAGAPLSGKETASATATQATHVEVECIGRTGDAKVPSLSSFCLDAGGNLLACEAACRSIKVIRADGTLAATWELPVEPERIARAPDGTLYVGGRRFLAKLDAGGKLLKKVDLDAGRFPATAGPAGIAVTAQHVFVSFRRGTGKEGGIVFRFDRQLARPEKIVTGLRGCCGRLDITALGDEVLVAENSRKRVLRYNADGRLLAAWPKAERNNPEAFGSCCNPMNITVGPDGNIYTAESGVGRIRRFSPDGKLLGLVGFLEKGRYTPYPMSCKYVPLAVSPDRSRVYVQEDAAKVIRVLKRKDSE